MHTTATDPIRAQHEVSSQANKQMASKANNSIAARAAARLTTIYDAVLCVTE